MPFFRRENSDLDNKEARGVYPGGPTKYEVRKATKTRKTFSLISSFFFLACLVFIILVEIGNLADKPVLRDTWFIRLNLSNVVPNSVDNSATINDIARTLGLHDFYQNGLWNFCEGYFGQRGITRCSNPKLLYWFNPVKIVENEILQGAAVPLPNELDGILDLVRGASKWIFGLYLTGACLTFILMFLAPLSLYSRANAFFLTLAASLNALIILAGTTLATAMYIILKDVFINSSEVNIGAKVGTQMFAFMWVASAFALLACFTQMCLMCCCLSRREFVSGRGRSQ